MGLRDIGAALPPGFRFFPSDEELVCHYLYKKISNQDVSKGTLIEIDLHTCEPWQLPEVAKLNSTEWYFFSFRDRKYATGFRTNRATTTGYWKATGKDRTVVDPRSNAVVGMRKTLVFYKNRAPNGIKTGWIMHEFRLENPHLPPKEDWVLCRVFHKSRTDNNYEQSLPNIFDGDASGDTSPAAHAQNLDSGRHHDNLINSNFSQSPPSSQIQNQNPNNNNYYQNLLDLSSTSSPNFLQLSHQHQVLQSDHTQLARVNEIMMINSKCEQDDDYGYLFDMGFDQEGNFGNGIMASNVEEMRFEDDHGLIFL